MTRRAIYVSIFIGAAILVFGMATQGHPIPAIGIALLGLAWMVAHKRRIRWVASPAFAIFVVISAASIWGGIASWMALTCVMFSLAAWDLALFVQRLEMTSEPTDRKIMERTHFTQLGFVIGLSLLGVFAITLIRINLTFGGAVILALLGVWGISSLVYRLRRHEDDIDL
ncbi:MAG: hypothetical protein HZB50_17960 [Chloroflexi bacterium]|nr:hypothetical protein [Chloroflexota bacterium]